MGEKTTSSAYLTPNSTTILLEKSSNTSMLPIAVNESALREQNIPFSNQDEQFPKSTSKIPLLPNLTTSLTMKKQSSTLSPLDYENESSKVIEEVKNTISGIIKEVVASNENSAQNSSFEDIVKLIKDSIPSDIAIKSLKVNEKELQSKIRETVGEILTDKEIQSVVRLRNNTKQNEEQFMTNGLPGKSSKNSGPVVFATEQSILKEDNSPSLANQEDKDNINNLNITSSADKEQNEVLVDIPNLTKSIFQTTTSLPQTSAIKSKDFILCLHCLILIM
jgi:hypothetical protein